jgi:hypothetical protein
MERGEENLHGVLHNLREQQKNLKPQKTLKLSLLTQESAAHPRGTKKKQLPP